MIAWVWKAASAQFTMGCSRLPIEFAWLLHSGCENSAVFSLDTLLRSKLISHVSQWAVFAVWMEPGCWEATLDISQLIFQFGYFVGSWSDIEGAWLRCCVCSKICLPAMCLSHQTKANAVPRGGVVWCKYNAAWLSPGLLFLSWPSATLSRISQTLCLYCLIKLVKYAIGILPGSDWQYWTSGSGTATSMSHTDLFANMNRRAFATMEYNSGEC